MTAWPPRGAGPRDLASDDEGRTHDKTDDTVWAVTCLFTRVGFRRRGVSRALARVAVDVARDSPSDVGGRGTAG